MIRYARIKLENYTTPKLTGWCRHYHIESHALDLIKKLLNLNPKGRPSAEDVLKVNRFDGTFLEWVWL